MSSESRQLDKSFDEIADQFVSELRAGKYPAIADYRERYPQHAAAIDELFPTLAELEDCQAWTSAGAATETASFDAPQRLGDYVVLREIGRGGMGVVYEARHDTMRRRVALKVLPKSISQRSDYLERFFREARAAGQLHHTNIVPVFEVGESDGVYFYAMQYIHGQNIDVVIDELRRIACIEGGQGEPTRHSLQPTLHAGDVSIAESLLFAPTIRFQPDVTGGDTDPSLSSSVAISQRKIEKSLGGSSQWSQVGEARDSYFNRVAHVGIQVADALEFAHEHGVLHRDIKPSNLILDTAGVAWITDFGLAKDNGENLTHTGDIVGTLRYMAPERFAGQSDRRSDIYSLALTLYELCTLQPAYSHTDRAQLVQQVLDSSPAAPRKIRPEIPRDLETVIIKAMAREPGSRYETAGQMAADLRRFVANRPVLARRVSLTERVWRWSRRHPSRAALLVSMMLLAAIVTTGSLYFGYQERQHAKELETENVRVRKAEQATSQALKEKETALAEKEAALAEKERKELGLQAHIFWSHYRNAEALHGSGVPGQNFKTVSECVEAYQRLTELGLGEHALKRRQLAVRAFAIAGMGSWDVNSPRKYHRDIPAGFTNVFGVDFANSRYAHSDEQGNIAICDLETGETISTLPGPGDQAWVILFSPDGRYLCTRHHHAMRNRSPLITIWNMETSEPVCEFLENDSFGDLAFATDGEHFALSHGSGEIGIYATADGEPIQSLKFDKQARFFHFANQNRELIVATRAEEPMIQFWSWQEDEPQLIREFAAPAAVDRLDWNEGLQQLAVACDTELHVWPPGDVDAEPTTFSGHGSKVVRLQLQPQGDLAMTYSWDRKTRLFDLVAGEEVLEIAGARMTFTGFSPDGRRIGFNNENDKIGIWEIPARRPFRMIRQSLTQGARRVNFHPLFSRLIAVPAPEGVHLIDHLHNESVMLVPSGKTSEVQFSSDGQYVLSGGERGVIKWPLAVHIDQHDRFQVDAGEPETIDGEPVSRFLFNDEQRLLLTTSGNNRVRLIRFQEQTELMIGPHERMSKFRMDPAATLVVTTTWQGQGVKVWDARTGDLIQTLLPECSSANTDFSPDGSTLVISTAEGQTFWATGSWELVREIPRDVNDGWHGGLDFGSDGELVAAAYTINQPQLIRAETGETVAVLDANPTIVVGFLKFSHDNRYLAILDDGLIHVWDLQAVQSGLAENGMHWK